MQIEKRNGDIVSFDKNRIINAINKAANETELGIDKKLSQRIASDIENELKNHQEIPSVEFIQDLIENKIMQSKRHDIAKRYIIYRQERNKSRENPQWEMTDIQKAIWENKYRFNNESFKDFLHRVSNSDKEIEKLIFNKKFLPAGRILAGRGTNKENVKVTLSNCFVLESPNDNLESIFEVAKKMARTYSYGGGCGIDISKLRPCNSKVNNAAKTTTGAISFMELYSMVTGLIGQHSRRGALMITLDCYHPDLIDFIKLKTDLNKVTKANISIKLTNDFFNVLENDGLWEMKFIVQDTGEEIIRYEKVSVIFNMICKGNWNFAEPGALFWSRIKEWNLLSEDKEFDYESTNPCANNLWLM